MGVLLARQPHIQCGRVGHLHITTSAPVHVYTFHIDLLTVLFFLHPLASVCQGTKTKRESNVWKRRVGKETEKRRWENPNRKKEHQKIVFFVFDQIAPVSFSHTRLEWTNNSGIGEHEPCKLRWNTSHNTNVCTTSIYIYTYIATQRWMCNPVEFLRRCFKKKSRQIQWTCTEVLYWCYVSGEKKIALEQWRTCETILKFKKLNWNIIYKQCYFRFSLVLLFALAIFQHKATAKY